MAIVRTKDGQYLAVVDGRYALVSHKEQAHFFHSEDAAKNVMEERFPAVLFRVETVNLELVG